MATKVTNGLDLVQTQLINALMHPISSDPATPAVGQVWFNTTDGRLKVQRSDGTKSLALLEDVTAGSVTGALWNADTLIKADVDDTPIPLTVDPSTVVGRAASGAIVALTAAQIRTILGVEAGATADQTAAQILAELLTVDGTGSGLDADTIRGTSLVDLATQSELDAAINDLISAAPGTLDTLNELAAALGDDPNFATTVTTGLNSKTGKYAADIGDGTATTYTVTHSLGSTDVVVSVRDTATNDQVIADISHATANTITVEFDTAPATGAYRVVVVG